MKYPNLVGTPHDYSKDENWMVKLDKNFPVDVFYLYPTSVDPKNQNPVSEVDEAMKKAAHISYERGPSLFEGFCNVYAPYYRQLTVGSILKAGTPVNFYNHIYNSEVRTDAYAALDYFFEHINKGKPFILASHSQGSFTMFHILREYMKINPEPFKRMIICYAVGMTVSNDFHKNNPHIKFAEGETDLGVVASWNTEAPGAKMGNFPVLEDVYHCINPLNWKIDDTYAPISLNKGSYDINLHKVVDGVCDAQIDLKRKVVITTTASKFGYKAIPAELKLFGDQSYHLNDWDFFYENIKENAKKRIAKYFEIHK